MPYRSIHARNTPAAAQIVSCAPKPPDSAPSHRPPSSADSSAGRASQTRHESCHRAAPARRSAPCAPGGADADCASARGSTARPPASTAAACRDARARRPRWPSAPPPASARTARRSRRCISRGPAPGCARARAAPGRIGAAASAAMFQAPRAFGPVASIEPLRLAIAHRHHRRRRPQAQCPRRHPRQHACPRQLSCTHRRPPQSATSGRQLRGTFLFR